MNPEALFLIFCSLFAVLFSWLIKRNTWEILAVWSLLCIISVSPLSAVWLVSSSLLVAIIMFVGDRWGGKSYLMLCGASLLTISLLFFRELPQFLWVGGAYFTLRNLHILFDWWMGKIIRLGVINNLRYQLFLPTLMAGPINRFQIFERQIARRRWDASEFFTGAERLLFGIAQVVILGGWLINQVEANILAGIFQTQNFFVVWIYSIIDWIELYFVFSGYSSIALGLSLMMGLRLEENFNRPWLAKDLIDFWLRWHITLSQWVRDYVFQPITALTRSPVIGLIAAMLVIGLWHESSVYYVLWALWQVIGIILTRLVKNMLNKNPKIHKNATKLAKLSPFYVLGWLSLANPVIAKILGLPL
ncbi:MAG: hypothetical protein L3K52_13815 [Candidatus Thiothrix sulfatifontis]|nr:MAG: hypothetical protein L3K52_13815 [Candidatus Thiothrix sulfatifontis]